MLDADATVAPNGPRDCVRREWLADVGAVPKSSGRNKAKGSKIVRVECHHGIVMVTRNHCVPKDGGNGTLTGPSAPSKLSPMGVHGPRIEIADSS